MVEANPEADGLARVLSEDMQKEPWIGIDLGTTYSAAAIFKHDRCEILQNYDDGMPTTPSMIAYTLKGEIIVGN